MRLINERNDKEAVRSILELVNLFWYNVEPLNDDGDTPLGLALQSGCYEEISQVYQDLGISHRDYLSNLTDLSFSTNYHGMTALLLAKDANAVKYLMGVLKNIEESDGYDFVKNPVQKYLEVRDEEGNTALHYWAAEGDQEAVRSILQVMKNERPLNENDDTPLDLATDAGHYKKIRQIYKELNVFTIKKETSTKRNEEFKPDMDLPFFKYFKTHYTSYENESL